MTTERLIVEMQAKIDKYERDMKKALKTTETSAKIWKNNQSH